LGDRKMSKRREEGKRKQAEKQEVKLLKKLM
jgi:hypothetical protein